MDTTTGRFTSMDSYLGSVDDPVSLHKYLYANANPVNYIDPTGYYTIIELETYMTASDSLQITMLKIDLSFLHNVTVSTEAVLLTVDLSRKLVDSMFDEGVSIGDAQKELVDCVTYMAKGKKKKKGDAEATESEESCNTEYKKTVSGKSAKEAAKDVPSWAKGKRPYKNENGNDFAKRLLDERYGEGNYKKGAGSEYNKIRKWGDRGFEK